ncbi:hypothetical protein ACHAXR_001741, partial [Thalassiosira sp. AJA248-18]
MIGGGKGRKYVGTPLVSVWARSRTDFGFGGNGGKLSFFPLIKSFLGAVLVAKLEVGDWRQLATTCNSSDLIPAPCLHSLLSPPSLSLSSFVARSPILAMQEAFLYTGQERDDIPGDVTRIRVVDPSVTRIPPLQNLSKLEEVELCEGVEEIGESAFRDCASLRRITIPSTVERILKHAFSNCTQLEEVELCEGLLEIGFGAFRCCLSL